jgi:hypothetical protein
MNYEVAPHFQHSCFVFLCARSWDLDPTERYTAWGSLVGAAFLHCAVYGVNQLQVQRYLTVPTIQAARKYAFHFINFSKKMLIFL